MMPITMWNEIPQEGDVPIQQNTVIINCDTVSKTQVKLGYKSTRAIKGRKRQSWLSFYSKFSISISELPEVDYNTVDKLFKSQEGYLVLLFMDKFYKIVVENAELTDEPTWSDKYDSYVYKLNLELEEDLEVEA